jgi:hypothetical protein
VEQNKFDRLVAWEISELKDPAMIDFRPPVGRTISLGNLSAFARFVPEGAPQIWAISENTKDSRGSSLSLVHSVATSDPKRVINEMKDILALRAIFAADPRPVSKARPLPPLSMPTINPNSAKLDLPLLDVE